MIGTVGVISFTDGVNTIEYETRITSLAHLKEFFDSKYDVLRFHEYLDQYPEKFWNMLEDKQWIDKPWPKGYGTPHWRVYHYDGTGERVPLQYWNHMQRVSIYDLKQRPYPDVEITYKW